MTAQNIILLGHGLQIADLPRQLPVLDQPPAHTASPDIHRLAPIPAITSPRAHSDSSGHLVWR
ncbi:hypothetical protein [Streptomyces sp. 2132.2]|uniref:hypothetical protein n=1 Tax=Streptomyces sp. 2132.2 TaxID=2485161 RepID=UPI001611167A|nr:hypothetical protein [Streptomyces sp. 2132.2]